MLFDDSFFACQALHCSALSTVKPAIRLSFLPQKIAYCRNEVKPFAKGEYGGLLFLSSAQKFKLK